MQRKTNVIPTAAIKRIMIDSGAKRVSDSAAKELADAILDLGLEIGQKALQMSKHSGRRTLNSDDIKLAIKK